MRTETWLPCLLWIVVAGGLRGAETRLSGGGVEIALAEGKVTQLTVSGRRLSVVPAPFVALCTVGKGPGEYAPGRLEPGPEGVLRATFAGLDEVVELSPAGTPGCLALSVRVIGRPGPARGYLLRFSLPFDAVGWRWHDDMQTAREIAPGTVYQNTRPLRAFADMPEWEGQGKLDFGHSNRNFCTVLTGPAGLCLAMPLDRPCLNRTAYDAKARRLDLVFDFALVPESRRPHEAEFQFLLYACAPKWGFRAALLRYYEEFPQWFVRHARRQGQWMAFTRLSSIDHADEFGFALQEGAPEPEYDDKLDVLSAVYFTHAGMGARIPDYDPEEDPLPAHDVQVAAVEAAFRRTTKEEGMFAAVGLHDREGRLAVSRWQVYAHLIAQFNLDPELPYGRWTLAEAVRRTEHVLATRKAALDGFYYDGLTTGVNYRAEHFGTADSPVLWDPFAGKPFLYNFFSSCEFARAAAELLRPRGQITMMNGALGSSYYVGPWLDVFGAETGLRIPRESFNYIRMVIHRKPFMTLLKGDYEQRIGRAEMELFMKRCLAYGVFPGFFDWPPSGLGPGGRYWDHAAYFERDRDLFLAYQPLCLALAEAGWSPVTHATSGSPSLFVERYGPDAAGIVYLTVLNETAHSQETTLSIDAEALGLGADVQAFDLVGSAPVRLERAAGVWRAALRVPPEGVLAIQLATPKQVAAWRASRAKELAVRGARMLEVNRGKPARPVHWLPSGKVRAEEDAGRRHAALDGAAHLSQWAMLFQDVPGTLTLRARIRGRNIAGQGPDAAALRCRIAWTTKSFSHYEWRSFPLPVGTYDWQEVSFAIESEHALRAIDVRPTLGKGTKGELWLDRISLVDASGREYLVDPDFDQWYLPLPEGVRPAVAAGYAELIGLLGGPTADLPTAHECCARMEAAIRQAKAENGGRRVRRDVAALRRHLAYAILARQGGAPPAFELPDRVVPGDALELRTTGGGAGTWTFLLDGRDVAPPVVVPADAVPGSTLRIEGIFALGGDVPTVRFPVAREARVVEPVSLELAPLGMDTDNGTARVRVDVRNNGRRVVRGALAGTVPPGWRVTLPPLPPVEPGGSASLAAALACAGKGAVASVPVTIAAEVGALRCERRIDVLFLPQEANRIRNPGFEEGMAHWSPYPGVSPEVVDGGHSGRRALSLRCPEPTRAGVYQTVVLDQKEACAILLQASADASEATGEGSRDFSLYVDLYHTDGTPSYGHAFVFAPGVPGWQSGTLCIEPRKPVARANVYLLFRQRMGAVRFDDVVLAEDARRLGNLARRAQVAVDSSYAGYTPAPLTDGIVEPGDRHWTEQAWASADQRQGHFVRLDFPESVTVRRVVVHWSRDAGVLRTSRRLRLESAEGMLWQAENLGKAVATEILLDAPARTRTLRLVQPAGGGPEERPGIFWIGEIEVFASPYPQSP